MRGPTNSYRMTFKDQILMELEFLYLIVSVQLELQSAVLWILYKLLNYSLITSVSFAVSPFQASHLSRLIACMEFWSSFKDLLLMWWILHIFLLNSILQNIEVFLGLLWDLSLKLRFILSIISSKDRFFFDSMELQWVYIQANVYFHHSFVVSSNTIFANFL